MDCNRCEYLNITEDEQREMGNKKGHYCKKYNKPVYHWGSDYCLHPVKECDIEDNKWDWLFTGRIFENAIVKIKE